MKKEELQKRFASMTDLMAAIDIARASTFLHKCFLHYTTLPALIGMIKGQSMWLTRGNSVRLDDAQESRKFGTAAQWAKTYIASFSYGEAENAAMWGLYCKGKSNAVRISIPAKAMREWIKYLQDKCASNDAQNRSVRVNPQNRCSHQSGQMASVDFQDMVYAAVNGRGYDEVRRRNVVSWNGVVSKTMASLKADIGAFQVTGAVKDYEWTFEQESRLIVRMAQKKGYGMRISIPVPEKVFTDMKITFGPWTTNEQILSFQKKLYDVFTMVFPGKCCLGDMCQRSVLHGALRKWAKKNEK